MYRSRFGRHRHGRPAVVAVIRTTGFQVKKKGICRACNLPIELGQPYVRLLLKARFRSACPTCSTAPKAAKRFHEACEPKDHNAAMGYFPNGRPQQSTPAPMPTAAAPPPPPPPPVVNRPPLPTRPVRFKEASLNAFVALEQAFLAKMREAPAEKRTEFEGDFRKYQGLKQHVLHPGNVTEGETALPIAMQKMVKLVFGSN